MRTRVAAWRQLRLGGLLGPDIALGVFMLAIAFTSTLAGKPDEGPLIVTVPTAVVMTCSLAWRRRFPLVPAFACAAADLFQTSLAQAPGSQWSLAALVIAMYSTASYCSEQWAALAGAVLVASLLVGEWLVRGPDYLFIVLVFGGVWLLGRAGRVWRERIVYMHQHGQDAARLAVAQERLRISRELHDVLGHSMSVIAVQADAAGAALESEPDLAKEPVNVIHSTARGSLAEIRAMVDMLRYDDDGTGAEDIPAMAPGLFDVDALLDRTETNGLPVTRSIESDLLVPSPAYGLTIYRVVQESLTNVMKHAGMVSTHVAVRRDGTDVVVEIGNSPGTECTAQQGIGYGLRGLRERLELLGGSMTAGPRADGGFAVIARLPAERAGDPKSPSPA
ncbi:sensor histidine kinase [Antricoccus suffuscus]|nr:histidine kinase [Antricoccus suffuscus]